MNKRSPLRIFLTAAFTLLTASPSTSASRTGDGYLHQRIGILVYGDWPAEGPSRAVNWILDREIRSFEAFLWKQSERRLFAETVTIRPGRRLKTGEFLYGGGRWGYLPRFSPEMVSDLKREGWRRSQFDALLILYEPLPGWSTPLAGATYLPHGISSIPLVAATFLETGRRHPLHRLLVHEFLHQLEFSFAEVTEGRYLISPDEEPEACPGGGTGDLERALRLNSRCSEIEWSILSPARGEWVPR